MHEINKNYFSTFKRMSLYEKLNTVIQGQTINDLTNDLSSLLEEISSLLIGGKISIQDTAELINSLSEKVDLHITDFDWSAFSLEDFLQLLPLIPTQSEFENYIVLKKYLQQLNLSKGEDSWLILTDNICWMSITPEDILKLEELNDSRAVEAAQTYLSPPREKFFIPENIVQFTPDLKRFYKQDGTQLSGVTPLTESLEKSYPGKYVVCNITLMLSNNVISDAYPIGINYQDGFYQ